jgi:non-heme chloroperoxidase
VKVTTVSGLTLSYVEQGGAEPAVVFLPGPTDGWRSYKEVLSFLPPSLRAVAVSQRGHGDSDKPERGFTVTDFAADLVPLLDALSVQKAVLAGHSGSCLVCRRVAIDSPERVAGLVLEASPTTLRGNERLQSFVVSWISSLEDPIDPEFAQSIIGDTSGGISPEMMQTAVDDVQAVPARVWKEMFGSLLDYDDADELARITAPTLLLWGDADDLVGREMQETLAEQLSAELVVYAGVGHTPRWENPKRFAGDVAAFVANL